MKQNHTAEKSKSEIATFVVKDDAMQPDFIPGDCILVTPSQKPRTGKPVVAKFADGKLAFGLLKSFTARSLRLSPCPGIDHGRILWVHPVTALIRAV